MEPAVLDQLKRRARAAAERAYAPASGYPVGAALRARDGRVFAGCNVENASYGLTICAERNAVAHAVAEGAREFDALVVCTPAGPPGYPCGACRQVLAEFAEDLPVVLLGAGEGEVHTSLAALIPHAFRIERRRP